MDLKAETEEQKCRLLWDCRSAAMKMSPRSASLESLEEPRPHDRNFIDNSSRTKLMKGYTPVAVGTADFCRVDYPRMSERDPREKFESLRIGSLAVEPFDLPDIPSPDLSLNRSAGQESSDTRR